jgi:hypothetical protein
VLAGCGGGHAQTADQKAAQAALQAYLTAFAHHDYTAACARLTRDAKDKIARRSRAPTLNLNRAGCAAQLAGLVRTVAPDQRGQVLEVLGSARVQSVKVTDGIAVATVRSTFRRQTQSQPVHLQRVGTAWLVNASPNPGS